MVRWFRTCRKAVKKTVMKFCIIREWVANGEFDNAERIIVAGSIPDAVIVSMLMKSKGKQIYRCEKMLKVYRYESKTKWIVFGTALKNRKLDEHYDVILVPNV